MSILEIITIPDPLLREVSKPVETIDGRINALIDDMFETMYEAPGIGLAAIQIALPRRIVVIDCGDPEGRESNALPQLEEWEAEVEAAEEKGETPPERPARKPSTKKPIALINPKIVRFGDEVSVYEEGCLSIPDYYADVERPAGCTVEYLDREGKKQTLEATGLLSTCIQHEIDHLDGKLFIDHISKLKREHGGQEIHQDRQTIRQGASLTAGDLSHAPSPHLSWVRRNFPFPYSASLIGHGHEIVAVYSQPPRPAGRGMSEKKSPVHEAAEQFGIPVFTPKSLKGEAEQAAVCRP